MFSLRKFLTTGVLAATFSLAHAEHHGTHSEDRHVHGEAVITIAMKNDKVGELELHLPGSDAVGFEHKPKTKEDKAKIAALKKRLTENVASIFGFPAAADCAFTTEEVEFESDDSKGKEPKHYHIHAEIDFNCKQVFAGELNVQVFDLAPSLTKIDLQFVGVKATKSKTLSPADRVFKL